MRELVSMAMLMSSTLSIMEEDAAFTERAMIRCAEIYADPDSITDADIDDDFSLSANTRCVGGLQ